MIRKQISVNGKEESSMSIDTQDLLKNILSNLEKIEYIKPSDIPNIDLYMDQLTTFMDDRLRCAARYPGNDKILTKTMINNYAKNDLIPPPVKKKYSKEHILLLIFIYYYKGILSISDIQTLFRPITENYFQKEQEISLEDIYKEVFSLTTEEIERMKKDVFHKFEVAEKTFEGASSEDAVFLRKFSFICLLSYDVYVKKMIIEKMIDELSEAEKKKKTKEKAEKKNAKETKG